MIKSLVISSFDGFQPEGPLINGKWGLSQRCLCKTSSLYFHSDRAFQSHFHINYTKPLAVFVVPEPFGHRDELKSFWVPYCNTDGNTSQTLFW